MMSDIDIAARFALACQFALLAIVLLRDHRQHQVGLFGGLFALAGFADLVSAPFGPRSGVIGAVLQVLSVSGALWLWLLARSLFEDAFRWRASYLLLLATLWTCSLGAYFYTDGHVLVETESVLSFDRYKLSLLPQQLLIAGLSCLSIHAAVKGWNGDLVERRRRFRRLFLIGLTLLLLVVSFSNYLRLGAEPNAMVEAIANLAVLSCAVLFLARLLRLPAHFISTAGASPFPSAEPVAADKSIVEKIRKVMEGERLYTEHGLTISRLAERLKEKEYRVRKAINGSMGYRNFSQFLNHYRIREAARRLTDEETRHLPVLTVALDVGFASLAPFNRAFKLAHGVTPTEYRRGQPIHGSEQMISSNE